MRWPILLLLTISLGTFVLAATTRSRGKKKTNDINICDIEKTHSPIYCHCNNIELLNATDVTCLVLSKFEESDVMWNYFKSQMYLRKLSFVVRGTGSLDYIPGQALKQFKNIEVLTIQDSKIHELKEHAFYILPTLSEINLSKNMIFTLKRYAFDSVKNLTVINLDENHIAEIHRNVFFSLPALKELYMNNNNVTIIHDKAFEHLTRLQELQLAGNQIAVITSDMFHGLGSLKRLDLSNNQISMIGDHTFLEVPELTELLLDHNRIEFIAVKALNGLRNLHKLRLSENKLTTLEADFLNGVPQLYLLDLRDNQLRTMTFDNIKHIITNLYTTNSHFYLDGNRLICDCKLAWIWGLRNETKNTKLRAALEELTCFLESNNATSKINSEDLERKQALEIARNPDGYLASNLKQTGGNPEEFSYAMDDLDNDYEDDDDEFQENYEDESSSNSKTPKVEVVGGKTLYEKHLFELRPEDLPCPAPSKDLMASEQPSSRHENAPVGSWGSKWFYSSAQSTKVSPALLLALLASVLLLASFSFSSAST
ncbi:connectin-like [Prorops nasuta]|uniref:connectin-like n=1 Tax=Prorops nasuta TaxID=863751 RepID=UPI0034CDF75F